MQIGGGPWEEYRKTGEAIEKIRSKEGQGMLNRSKKFAFIQGPGLNEGVGGGGATVC